MIEFQGGTNLYSNVAVTNTKIDVVAVGSQKKKVIVAFECFNTDATNQIFIQFFDALAANVTLGTTVPTFVLAIPSKGAIFGRCAGILFGTAICIAATSTANGLTAPATAQIVQFEYV
jgi:hypothetical protein